MCTRIADCVLYLNEVKCTQSLAKGRDGVQISPLPLTGINYVAQLPDQRRMRVTAYAPCDAYSNARLVFVLEGQLVPRLSIEFGVQLKLPSMAKAYSTMAGVP